jgi:TonB family protein
MTPRVVLILLFVVSAAAQPYAPQPQKVPFCGGIVNGIINPPCTTPPRRSYTPAPEFPKQQGKAHFQGTVQLALVVDPDGLTRDITVFRSLSPDFDEMAIDAVKKWKFYPATLDGTPVATKIKVEVTFSRR